MTTEKHAMSAPRRERFAGVVDFEAVRRERREHAETGLGLARPEAQSVGRTFSMPGLSIYVADRGVELATSPGYVVLCADEPRLESDARAGVGANAGHAAAWLRAYEREGERCLRRGKGAFALVFIDLRAIRVTCAVDRFAVSPLCYRLDGARLEFSDRADALPLASAPEIDAQAIFDYLYFHVIPAPRTIHRGVMRLNGAETLVFDGRRVDRRTYWAPEFVESGSPSIEALKHEFRALMRDAVAREARGGACGAFLSGGTDSSTVAGMLGQVTGEPARTYSIGFDAEGYDEMAYARIAAKRFRTDHHEYYVTPQDLIEGIPLVATHYDQPFGNASALPAYFCAKVAHADGTERLLAGDGGDELFGGNSRYAKQRVLGIYDELPKAMRERVLEPIVEGVPGIDKVPIARKFASYVRQARLPMPQRMETYNLLGRLGVTNVLTPEFLAHVDVSAPWTHQREVFEACTARSIVNRMLAYDWKFTLSDNDLPKVRGTSALAGVDVGFPLLADEIVDFSLRLPPQLKLKGMKLRYFFKEALRGFLPDEILAKKKHGFALPFGVWLTRHETLRDFALASLESLRRRRIVQEAFMNELMGRRLPQHPGYFGGMVWILIMLEQWLGGRQHQWKVDALPVPFPGDSSDATS